jgi:hypothetical protein
LSSNSTAFSERFRSDFITNAQRFRSYYEAISE